MGGTQPNILYILADEHRHDALGCAGNDIVTTPNMDSLASAGVRLSTVWCQSPLCQPSRASILTGRYPHDVGVCQNFQRDFDPNWETVARRLQECGYETAAIGKLHYLSSHELVQDDRPINAIDASEEIAKFGYDHVVEEFDRHVHANPLIETPYKAFLREAGLLDQYLEMVGSVMPFTDAHWDSIKSAMPEGFDQSSYLTEQALQWLRLRTADAPFFLQLSYVQPHSPLIADQKWSEYYQDVPVEFGPRDEPAVTGSAWGRHLARLLARSRRRPLTDDYLRHATRTYYAMVSAVDESIGRIVRALDQSGRLEDTWIIYSSDHGQMLGDHGLMAKGNFYRSSVQVPAIIRPPRGSPPAHPVVDGLVELVDLTATILDIVGSPALEASAGRSLLSVLRGQPTPELRPFVFSEIGGDGDSKALFWAVCDSHTRVTIEKYSGEVCEVFDLDSDPEEVNNLVESRRGKAIVATAQEYLHEIAVGAGATSSDGSGR